MRVPEPVRALRTAVIAAAGSALVVLASFALVGDWRYGAALASGLLLGSLNGPWTYLSLRLDLPFRAHSVTRLAVLSAAGIGIGLLIAPATIWMVAIGLAAAQLLLAAASLRESLRIR